MQILSSTRAFARLALLAAAAAFLAAPAPAPAPAQAPDFSPEAFRAHVAFLADDLLEGREPGTRGYDLAARYVATRLEALGLRPAGEDGSWYQQVPLVRHGLGGSPTLSAAEVTIRHGEGAFFRATGGSEALALDAPAVFAGHGIDLPARGFDDYRGLDVRGKVVVVLPGVPNGTPSDVGAHLQSDKARMAALRGAIGLIELRPASNRPPSPALLAALSRPVTAVADPAGNPVTDAPGLRFSVSLEIPQALRLFAGDSARLQQAGARAAAGQRVRGFQLRRPLRITHDAPPARTAFTSPNVVAVLPGSDPALAGEYVVLMAHLDHLGIRQSGDPASDRIRNGAMDNATGIATLIEVARQMSEAGNRPRRSILFAAVTAEELGLLGAQHLASNPVVDGRIVGLVNLDMPVLTYNFTDVIAFGAEHSTLGPIVRRAAAGMGVALTDDPLPEQGLFTRSDHYMFVQKGIPSVFLMTGFAGEGERRFREFLGTRYHSPADDLTLPFDWGAGARFAELNYRIAREIADSEQAPLWYRDSFFGHVFAPRADKARRPAPPVNGG
jgi:hypothetical protein